MKKYINKGIVLFAFGVFLLNSCESTLDINESEVSPTIDLVNPDLLLAGAINSPRARFMVTTSEMGSILMNQWAGDINNVTGGFQDEFRMNFTQNYFPATSTWRDIYRGMGTYQSIINFEGTEYNNHKAIARILKSYYFQSLVDIFGDIPYSQALQFGVNLTPAYDDDQSIYRALIVDIDLAIATINNPESNTLPVGMEDTVFNGDLNGWIQVANTLKLRILLRQAELANTDGDTATYLNEQFASLNQNFVTADAIMDPGYENAVGKQNPFWANYGEDTEGNDTFDNDFIVPSDYMAEFLKGEVTENGVMTGVLDERLTRIYEPIPAGLVGAGEVIGVIQGATNTNAPPELSELGPGLLIGSEQVSYLFTAAESYFLQAEAAERGYISGNAQAMFENGITASFSLLGIPGEASGYITASQNVNLIGWSGSSNKIEAIMTQKWIALCGINAVESWIDYTKTGYPDVPMPIIAEQATRPNRMLYPASEYSTNSANVPNQPSSEAWSTRIFWDVN